MAKAMTPSRHRRGGRILLWMFAFFVAGQLGGGALLDRLWPQLRFPFLYQQLDRLDAQPQPPDIVFLGSSRFGSGVSGEHVTEWLRQLTGDEKVHAFNAAIPAGDPVVCEVMLQHLLQRGIRPRLLVIEICPESVNHRNDWVRIHVDRQLGWSDVPTYLPEIARSGGFASLLANRLVPLYRHRTTLCEELGKTIEHELDGWLDGPASSSAKAPAVPVIDWDALVLSNPRLTKNEQQTNTQMGLHAIRRCLRSYRAGGTSGAALERLLQLCQANGITPLLVGVPLTQAHRDLYVGPIEDNYQAYLSAISEKYGCRYVEYRHRVPDRLFLDNHHADEPGRLMFSHMFTEEVLLPWWRENGSLER